MYSLSVFTFVVSIIPNLLFIQEKQTHSNTTAEENGQSSFLFQPTISIKSHVLQSLIFIIGLLPKTMNPISMRSNQLTPFNNYQPTIYEATLSSVHALQYEEKLGVTEVLSHVYASQSPTSTSKILNVFNDIVRDITVLRPPSTITPTYLKCILHSSKKKKNISLKYSPFSTTFRKHSPFSFYDKSTTIVLYPLNKKIIISSGKKRMYT
jgi:hypothetical protein